MERERVLIEKFPPPIVVPLLSSKSRQKRTWKSHLTSPYHRTLFLPFWDVQSQVLWSSPNSFAGKSQIFGQMTLIQIYFLWNFSRYHFILYLGFVGKLLYHCYIKISKKGKHLLQTILVEITSVIKIAKYGRNIWFRIFGTLLKKIFWQKYEKEK